MSSYREFWNELIYGSDRWVGTSYGFGHFWTALVVLVAVCFILGVASRWRSTLPWFVTLFFFLIYLVSVGPFILWTLSCTSCDASFSSDEGRSLEIVLIQNFWGGFYATGVAVLWLGVLASYTFRAWQAAAVDEGETKKSNAG